MVLLQSIVWMDNRKIGYSIAWYYDYTFSGVLEQWSLGVLSDNRVFSSNPVLHHSSSPGSKGEWA
jgi:hypothetical protein